MLDRADMALSIRRQCMLLGIARSGVYLPPRPANDNDLALMRRLDELFTAWPFLGSRRMTAMLKAEGLQVNRKRVQRLMRKMGIAALGPRPNTTRPAPGHKIYPYLLRNMTIDRPNQVWGGRHHVSCASPQIWGSAYDWNAKEKGGRKKTMTCPLL
ncbi:UNVERIFIED_ORG: putative transposase [Bradyrhizobium japonicum]|uniref:IS3 family transposase n=2 Tax=Bradyrhizobium elkanii TaxID=29448 RepID=UPI0035147608